MGKSLKCSFHFLFVYSWYSVKEHNQFSRILFVFQSVLTKAVSSKVRVKRFLERKLSQALKKKETLDVSMPVLPSTPAKKRTGTQSEEGVSPAKLKSVKGTTIEQGVSPAKFKTDEELRKEVDELQKLSKLNNASKARVKALIKSTFQFRYDCGKNS